ncbi:hypothetical protein, partial [Mycobacterium avium]|uniref:hypothetical protein n=1 Tax=Mycobacterium avium TaxID=1764 RepID=UPI001F228CAD
DPDDAARRGDGQPGDYSQHGHHLPKTGVFDPPNCSHRPAFARTVPAGRPWFDHPALGYRT